MQHSSGFIDLINHLKQNVKEVDINYVKDLDTSKTALVDVRENEEWDDGFIPGAIHLSKGILERDIEKVIPNRNQEIVLYCRGGMRSIIAADCIQKMGYSNVSSMAGGITAWQHADYPVECD